MLYNKLIMKILKTFTLLILIATIISCKVNTSKTVDIKPEITIPVLSKDSLINDQLKTKIDAEINNLEGEKAEYLKFLYAYMSLNDRMDYSFSYYCGFVDITIEIKNTMTWGSKVPENIFNHFVLPHRVNNEDLDTSRQFFFHQLKSRLDTMDMLDAALEVNHWCHEHVTYQASDSRTSAPLATYKKGYGRCGEESTFTVAALRSVGIPARQVYTPRWAHTDDNHAWVEFWANGKWYFMGACEPESIPNAGWFTEPARRAMLVEARVFGPYTGTENILFTNSYRSSNNSLYVYAPVKKLHIKVVDNNNMAVEKAQVNFQIYNYAEFYSLYSCKTNENGMASFETGIGDLLVWANTDSSFAYKLIRNEGDTFTLVLDRINNSNRSINIDYNPPIKPEPRAEDKKLVYKNKIRLAYEDSLRNSFEADYIDSISCVKIAKDNKINSKKFWLLIKNSRANWNELVYFVNKAPTNLKGRAMDILQNISLKDLQDCRADILLNHLSNAIQFENTKEISEEEYIKYVLNPRIDIEVLWAWRSELKNCIGDSKKAEDYFLWIKNNVQINDTMNYSGIPINPKSVFKLKLADKFSRDLLLIAMWRANGIAGRFEGGTYLPQYFENGKWNTLNFNIAADEYRTYGYLHFEPQNKEEKLQYFKHFTIAKLENGIYNTLKFEWDKNIEDFTDKIKLSTGSYRLCVGNRMADGSVLAQFEFFEIAENEVKEIVVGLRKSSANAEKLGNLNEINNFAKTQTKNACTVSNKTFKIIVWYRPNNEPSKHALEDIAKAKTSLNIHNTELWLIGEQEYDKKSLDSKYFSKLLAQTFFYTDRNLDLLKKAESNINKEFGSEFPYVVVLNARNEVIYISEGYTIGLGEDINKLIEKDIK